MYFFIYVMSVRLRAPLLCFLSETQTDQTPRTDGAGYWQTSSVPAALTVEELDPDPLNQSSKSKISVTVTGHQGLFYFNPRQIWAYLWG